MQFPFPLIHPRLKCHFIESDWSSNHTTIPIHHLETPYRLLTSWVFMPWEDWKLQPFNEIWCYKSKTCTFSYRLGKIFYGKHSTIRVSIYKCTSKYVKNSLLNWICRKPDTSGGKRATCKIVLTANGPTISRLSHVVERDFIRTDSIMLCWRLASLATKMTVKFVKVTVVS